MTTSASVIYAVAQLLFLAPQSRFSHTAQRLGGRHIAGSCPHRTSRVGVRCSGVEAADDAYVEQLADLNSAPELKYQPSTDVNDPVVRALMAACKSAEVTEFELLDSRWNGNEAFKYTCAAGTFFVKLNRVESPSVFMTEAIGLTTIARADAGLRVPKPLHIGSLPGVGNFGPGAFMVLEWLQLRPFGAMQPKAQAALGAALARLHKSEAHAAVHQGRYGFMVNNFLALTPLNNTWDPSWPSFFSRRLRDQLLALSEHKAYGQAATDTETAARLQHRGEDVLALLPTLMEGAELRPAILHGDLWVGNTGAISPEEVVAYDPACFFGHSEFDLALPRMFGGLGDPFFDAYHEKMPRAPGFERRADLYQLYQYLNQLNLFGDPAVLRTCESLMDNITSAVSHAPRAV